MRQPISKENYAFLLQRYETAKITAKSFPGGLEWFNQMNQAYENMDWQWLDNLCTGVNQALQEHTEKSRKSSRELPQRELTPAERLDLARRKK
jgi:hypothetical protein